MKLLLVDDEPLILDGLAKIVGQSGLPFLKVEKAGDAFEALSIMVEFAPDVTITDLNMPEQNGFELISNARKAMACDRFIILTGYDEFEYARQAVRVGAIDYLLKPINEQEVVRLLQGISGELEQQAGITSDPVPNISRMLDYIENHYNEDISLDSLTTVTGLHPNYISGLFRKETGQTFIYYLNSLRIRKACELLTTHRLMSVHQVGRNVGLENPQHFTKVFKKFTGITPGTYREESAHGCKGFTEQGQKFGNQ
ncbi:response regulator [Paenibacillaceae bacterium]|nr:response regulator [Paenibacillaceae bacterium]